MKAAMLFATAALIAAVTTVLSGCGGSGRAGLQLQAAPPGLAKRLLTEQLHAKQLDFTWVACVKVGRSYQHVLITRCNVDFGVDPHVEGYCVLLKNGKLATNHQDPAIPCKHDNAGWDRTTITS